METATEYSFHGIELPLPEAMRVFFASNSAGFVRVVFYHLLISYVGQPKEDQSFSEEEITLFLDQLMALVAAAEQLHEAGRVGGCGADVGDVGDAGVGLKEAGHG